MQWAHTDPPAKLLGYQNPRWPGCCRPLTSSEHCWIQASDWLSASVVHHVPIPPDIKVLLDSVPIKISRPATNGRSTSRQLLIPALDQRNSHSSSPSQKSNHALTKTPPGQPPVDALEETHSRQRPLPLPPTPKSISCFMRNTFNFPVAKL